MVENIWLTSSLWIGLALLAALISIRIAVSVALIEIVLGAVGGNLLGMAPNDWVNYLAGVGAILLTFLAGTEIDPKVVRKDDMILFNWGDGSPDPAIPLDNFSVRWTGSLYLRAGDYDFFPYTDDGVRLYVDGQLVIDEWHDQGPTQYRSSLPLSEGTHFIRMEYFDRTGGAQANLWWHNVTVYPLWLGEYFSNKDLSGSPTVVRGDDDIDFDWSSASPADGVPQEGFSVRWTGDFFFDSADYTFNVTADDGVRLWIDGVAAINEWRDQGETTFTSVMPLSEGFHFVRMEYYQNIGGAVARISWTK